MAQVLDKFAAGELIRKRREERGLTQEQVVEGTSVPVAAYLSELENGKVNVARSKHFGSLVAFLRLSEDDIRAINPAAVITVAAPEPTLSAASRALSAGAKYKNIPRQEVIIPDTLQQAADEYGHLPIYRGLRSKRTQEFMINGTSREFTPTTVEGWLNEFADLKRLGYIKEDES